MRFGLDINIVPNVVNN